MTASPVVLVVASWYPSVDSLSAGRFVADQVTVLQAAGRFAPLVATFDPLALWGSAGVRRREAAAVRALAAAGLAAFPGDTLHPLPWRSTGALPVARLPVPGIAGGVGPADRAAVDRATVLERAAGSIDAVAGPPVLLHAHTGFPDGAAGAAEAARRGIPLVITEHATFLARVLADPARRAKYRAAGLAASRVIAVGGMLADQIRTELPELADRLVVIPNVVDADAFAAEGPEPRRDNELLFVGFRIPTKGIGLLLESFARARALRPALRLRLVGAAPTAALDAEWRRRAAALKIADAVLFEPEMDRAGVAAAMARATLFVHPSARETFGVVAAEALVAGLPVVAVDSGGVTEVLGPDPDENGAVVPPGDPGLLAEAIVRVLDRRDDYRPEVLRDRAIARFGPAAVGGRLADTYQEALAEGPRDHRPARLSPTTAPAIATVPPAPGDRTVAEARPEGRTIVVVGLDRVRAVRILESVAPAERRRLRLVTADGEIPTIPAGLAGVRTVPGFAARHAALRSVAEAATASSGRSGRCALLARPAVILREIRLRTPGRERALLAAATGAVESLAVAGDGLVALDGFDALAAEPLVRRGILVPLPGAGRWLAGGGTSGAATPRTTTAEAGSSTGLDAPDLAGSRQDPGVDGARPASMRDRTDA